MRAMLLLAFALLGCAFALAACGGSDVSRSLGAQCDRVSDCADRCLGPSGDYPAGFCTVDCTSSGDCPADGECVDREGGVCLFPCSDAQDCNFLGPGWTCKEDNLRGDPQNKVMVCRGD